MEASRGNSTRIPARLSRFRRLFLLTCYGSHFGELADRPTQEPSSRCHRRLREPKAMMMVATCLLSSQEARTMEGCPQCQYCGGGDAKQHRQHLSNVEHSGINGQQKASQSVLYKSSIKETCQGAPGVGITMSITQAVCLGYEAWA